MILYPPWLPTRFSLSFSGFPWGAGPALPASTWLLTASPWEHAAPHQARLRAAGCSQEPKLLPL